MDMLHQIRDELLTEAASSPAMLTDIAGLERYVSESYSNRAFIELLQNADDAKSSKVTFIQGGDWVLVANSGRPFSEQDFRSICRSASSKKSRGESIGYRGIGFKSVVGISSQVHLISGELSATFDRELTRAALGTEDLPVPLVRIPHPLSLNDPDLIRRVSSLEKEGFRTFFILAGIDSIQVENEFEKFDSDHLLFLKSVEQVRTSSARDEVFSCRRSAPRDGVVELVTTSPSSQETWRVVSRDAVSVAVATEAGSAVPLERSQSLVHAFLPTQEETGIPARINGDFSTDPSRTRVVLDQDTDAQLDSVASLINSMISTASPPSATVDPHLIACLTPYVDDITLQFERSSFRVALATKLRSHLSPMKDRLTLGPAWLNESDVQALEATVGKAVISGDQSKPSPLATLAKFCGSGSTGPDDVVRAARHGSISTQGFAELVAHVVGSVVPTGATFQDLYTVPSWPSPEGAVPLGFLADNSLTLDSDFLDSVQAAGLDLSVLQKRAVDFDDRLATAFPTLESSPRDQSSATEGAHPGDIEKLPGKTDPFAPTNGIARPSLLSQYSQPNWRSAEKSVHELLESQLGFHVEDRTRQNIGYDLWAHKNSEEYFVEVKSLSYPGQPFTLTPNEDSFARDHGSQYVLALVLRTEENTSVQFIKSPRDSLNFERQCRQWVWECNYYKFNAQYTFASR